MTQPTAIETKLAAGDAKNIARDLEHGERLVVVLEMRVSSVATKDGAGGAVLSRTLTPVEPFELEGELGRRTLNALTERVRTAAQAGAADVLPGIGKAWDEVLEREAGAELKEVDGAIVDPETASAVLAGEPVPPAAAPEPDGDAEPPVDRGAIPPFDGYDPATIPVIKEWLEEKTGDEKVARARWVTLYETEHKARKSLLDYCYGILEPLGDAPELPPADEAFGPGDDELELGDDVDIDDVEPGDFEPNAGDEDDDDLDLS